MAQTDDKKIIFSMVGVSKIIPPSRQILKDIYLSFYYGAKIGIIGLNGAGKSTLLRIIAGKEKSYNGEVVFSPGYSVGMLDQEPELDDSKTVKEVVEEGVQQIVDYLKEYEEINNKFAEPDEELVPVAIGEREDIRKKPAPDTVIEALRQLGATADGAVYIGDSDVDIDTARNSANVNTRYVEMSQY